MQPLPTNAPLTLWLELTQQLLSSFQHWTGHELISRESADQDLLALWNAPMVVVSHGTQRDPSFLYGNRMAMELWEMGLDEFLGMPSRLTAEPMHRDERSQLLERTHRLGFVDDYQGVRISKSGQRFRIEQATLWNVFDATNTVIGQAAAFSRWTKL